MNDDDRTKEALFRHAILGEVLSRSLRRGELRLTLVELSEKTFEDYQGRPRRIAHKTLEEWLYKYRRGGFEALKPQSRSDQGSSRSLPPEIGQLVVDLKREDPGRSAPLILRELELAGSSRLRSTTSCPISGGRLRLEPWSDRDCGFSASNPPRRYLYNHSSKVLCAMRRGRPW